MDYKKIETNEYSIHLIKTKKFHTINLRVCFTDKVSKEKMTFQNALIDTMTYATKNYDSKEKLIKKCQNLYSLCPLGSCVRYGNLIVTKFGFSCLDSIYVDHHNLIENIELLKELILNPLAKNNAFKDNYFNIVKNELTAEALTINEDPRLYANYNLLKKMGNDDNYVLTGYCDLDELKKVTKKSLYQEYLNMLHNSKIDIFVAGNIQNEEEIIKTIKKNFVFNNHFSQLVNPNTYHNEKRDIPQYFHEKSSFIQSKISLGYKFYDLTDDESRYYLAVFNSLLGGSDSLLMQNVRDKNSMCYYINSYINKLDNILIINTGINKENYDEVMQLISETIAKVVKGDFAKIDLNKAKMECVNEIENLDENPSSIVDYYYGMDVFHSKNKEYRSKMVKKATKKDMISIAKKINLDTVYYLEGEL